MAVGGGNSAGVQADYRRKSTNVRWLIEIDEKGGATHKVNLEIFLHTAPPSLPQRVQILFGEADTIIDYSATVAGTGCHVNCQVDPVRKVPILCCDVSNTQNPSPSHPAELNPLRLDLQARQPAAIKRANGLSVVIFGNDCTLLNPEAFELTIKLPVVGFFEYSRRFLLMKIKREKPVDHLGIYKIYHFEDAETGVPNRRVANRHAQFIYHTRGQFPKIKFLYQKGGNFYFFPFIILFLAQLIAFSLSLVASYAAAKKTIIGWLDSAVKYFL